MEEASSIQKEDEVEIGAQVFAVIDFVVTGKLVSAPGGASVQIGRNQPEVVLLHGQELDRDYV